MSVTIKLDRKLDFRCIPQMTEALEAALGSDVILDASDVSQIGTQAVQLLLSAVHSSDLMKCQMLVSDAGPQLREQLLLLGVSLDGTGRLEVAA